MNRFVAAVLSAVLAAPASAAVSRGDLKKALDANPDLVLEALKKTNKATFFEYVMDAQREYQLKQAKEAEEKEKEELEAAFKNPYKPAIDAQTRVRGNKDAPLTLVEYSDFQCPYCGRGYKIVEQLRQKYGSKIRFVYKNMPLTAIHPMAMPAAKWLEAVALQSPDKAWVFHDTMFENQGQLGEDFFKKTVKDLGLDAQKAAKDADSPAVAAKIETDVKEAKEFGFTGTPGFLLNGIPLRGAYPLEEFDKIIKRLGV